jgi:hypothetical protein
MIRPQTRNDLEISLFNPLKKELTVAAFDVYLSPDIPIESQNLAFYAPVDLAAGGALYAKQGQRGSRSYPPLAVKIAGGQEKKFSIDLSSLLWGSMIDETFASRSSKSLEASGAYQIFARVTVKGYKHQMTSNKVPVTWLQETKQSGWPK